jgi:hypothetical protein
MLALAVLPACDNDDDQPQPTAGDTVYTDITYTTVYIDQQNNIKRYYQHNSQNQLAGFTRFETVSADTVGRFDFDADSLLMYARYYCLNNNGYAYKHVGFDGLGIYTDSVLYSYDNQNRLTSTNTFLGNGSTGYITNYEWEGNLIESFDTRHIEYTLQPLLVDVFRINDLGFDNTLSGINPSYHLANIYIPPAGPGGHAQTVADYGYTFTNQGYVSSLFTRTNFNTDTIKGFKEHFTYIVE